MKTEKLYVLCFLRVIMLKRTEYIRVYSYLWIRRVQSCLDVGKLSVCSTARHSRSYQWMVGSPPLSSAQNNAERFPLTQLSPLRPFTTLLQCGSASHIPLWNMCSFYPMFTAVRFRRRKMNRKSDAPQDTSAEDEVNC